MRFAWQRRCHVAQEHGARLCDCASAGRRDPICGVVSPPRNGAVGGNTRNAAAREGRKTRQACVFPSAGLPPRVIPRRPDGPAAQSGARRGDGRWRTAEIREPQERAGPRRTCRRAPRNNTLPTAPAPPPTQGSSRADHQQHPASKERVICCTHFAQPLKRELIKQNQEQPQKRKATIQLVPSVSKSKPAICEAGKLRTETSPLAVLDPDYCRVHVLENKHCISLFKVL